MTAPATALAAVLAWLAPPALLALPLALTTGATPIEICIVLLVAALLAHSVIHRDWAWLNEPWMTLALIWWGWLLLCSLPGLAQPGIWPRWTLQAALMIRLPLCAAAVAWILRTQPALRPWLHGTVMLAAAYVVGQLAWQFLTGANLFGVPIADNGLLSGPFDRFRAGPTLSHLFFPVLLPPVLWLMRRGRWGWLAGTAVLASGLAIMLPIGQRMPVLLVGLGLLVAALLLPTLRRPVLLTALAGAVMLAAGWVLFPAAQQRLVSQFAGQMASFPTSHYGLIYTRAAAMAAEHPWHGRGFAGFRTGCPEPRYFAAALGGTPADGGGAEICVTHAHNLYLEALTDAGWPGLAMFSAFALAILLALGRGLRGDGLRLGLFLAALLHLWPLAASHAFVNAYMGGWFALLLGWGLARARP